MLPQSDVADHGTIKSVVVMIAMEAEAKPLLEALKLRHDQQRRLAGPIRAQVHSGEAYGLNLYVICNGKCKIHGVDQVGTVPAALTAYLALEAFKPDLLVCAGTAGGFAAQNGSVGDVYLARSVMNHDRRMLIPGFEAYGIGTYQCIPAPKLAANLNLKIGIVSSGNSLDYTAQDLETLVKYKVAIKDMEAAAIASMADLFETPCIIIKAITDIVDGGQPTQEEFLRNLSSAAQSLQHRLPLLLQFVAGRSVTDL